MALTSECSTLCGLVSMTVAAFCDHLVALDFYLQHVVD